MMNRRDLITTSGATLLTGAGLTGCGAAPAAVSAAGSSAVVAESVAAVANTVAVWANVAYGLVFLGGALSKKKTTAILQGTEAVIHAAEGVERAAKPAATVIRSVPEPGDTLLKMQQLVDEVRSLVTFYDHVVLPGKAEPERWYIFQPVIWDGSREILGRSYEIAAKDMVGTHSIYSPDYEEPPIETPGLYRVGYRVSSENRDAMMIGGGPFLHIFANEDWNYERILQDYGDQRPERTDSPVFQIDPMNDLQFAARRYSS